MINIKRFNEGKDINSLEADIINAFAYISDDNKVDISIKLSEVIVDIKTILPSSTIYNDIDEYVNMHNIWNETILDINVIVKQITTDKDYIGFKSIINTVGNIRLNFYIKSTTLFKTDNNSITISKLSLIDILKEYIQNPIIDKHNGSNTIIIYSGESAITTIRQREISKKLSEVFNGLTNDSNKVTIITGNNHDVYNIKVDFRIFKRNGNSLKSVRLQNII